MVVLQGVWTDGVRIFSAGLDQRLRTWRLQRVGHPPHVPAARESNANVTSPDESAACPFTVYDANGSACLTAETDSRARDATPPNPAESLPESCNGSEVEPVFSTQPAAKQPCEDAFGVCAEVGVSSKTALSHAASLAFNFKPSGNASDDEGRSGHEQHDKPLVQAPENGGPGSRLDTVMKAAAQDTSVRVEHAGQKVRGGSQCTVFMKYRCTGDGLAAVCSSNEWKIVERESALLQVLEPAALAVLETAGGYQIVSVVGRGTEVLLCDGN
jgi:hypothetical protein